MSRNFNQITGTAYKTQILGFQVNLCGLTARVAPVNIVWTDYPQTQLNDTGLVSAAVLVNLQQGVVNPIKAVVAIYVDNSGSAVPVYVQFPDTNFVAVVSPFQTAFVPVMTNVLQAKIIAEGFVLTDEALGIIPQTRIFFCDTYLAPFSSFEQMNVFSQYLKDIGNDGVIRSPQYGLQALGDVVAVFQFPLLAGNFGILRTQLAFPNFIYLSALYIQIFNLKCNTPGTFQGGSMVLETSSGFILQRWNYIAPPDDSARLERILYSETGLNIKSDGTLDLLIFVTDSVDNGSVNISAHTTRSTI
jgi:hypothetical protein